MDGTFKLEINLGNAALCEGEHVAGALRAVADKLEDAAADAGPIYDENGNLVGRWSLTSPEISDLLAQARLAEPTLDPDDSELSRFERCADRVLALALETIAGHGLQDDFVWDSNDVGWDRIGRWLTAETEDGFRIVEEFATEDEAIEKLEELADDESC